MKRLVHKTSPIVCDSFGISIYHLTTKKDNDNYVKNHYHSVFEFIWVTKGEFQVVVNQKNYFLNENCAFMFNSKQIHYIKTLSDKGEYYSISINDEFIDFNFKSSTFKNHVIKDKQIIDYIKMIIIEFKKDTLVSEFCLKSQICDFLNLLLEKKQLEISTEIKRIVNINTLKQIEIVLNYIHENFTREISLEELSEMGNFSQSWLNTLFKRITGQTPISYIKSLRLKKAAELLENSELSITEISFSIGFYNVSVFNNAFKKQYAMSPKDYKIRIKKD